MKQSLLDVLIYLFEHLVTNPTLMTDQESIALQLREAGFHSEEIEETLDWLTMIEAEEQTASSATHGNGQSLRIYREHERVKLGVEGCGLLLFLEQSEVIDANSRELIIECALATDKNSLTMDQLKWIILMVLYNRSPKKSISNWLAEVDSTLTLKEKMH